MGWIRRFLIRLLYPEIEREVAAEIAKELEKVEKKLAKKGEELATEKKQILNLISQEKVKAVEEITITARKTREELENEIVKTAAREKETFFSEAIEKIPQKIIKAARFCRGRKVKIIFDGENYCSTLNRLKREWIDLLDLLEALKKFLEENEEIGKIYFYDSETHGTKRGWLWEKLRQNKVKVKIISPQPVISKMRDKEIVDPYIGVEISNTIKILRNKVNKVVLLQI